MKILLFIGLFCLSGCVTPYPQDIRILSVAPSSSYDIPDFPHRSLPELALKLTFQSAFDLAEYTRDSYGTDISATFCDEALQFRDYAGSPAPSLAWSWIYADNGQQLPYKQLTRGLPESVDRKRYHAYLFAVQIPPAPGRWSHPDHSWDLQADPHDVCVRIGTLKEVFLLRTQSNVMRIPAAVIRAALGQTSVR